ncbi:MAG TPA: O-antigen ligase family protein [Desulfatiglandales bacterium]|nr:O-antigen ligase family protein [Desulfatiglandales bacterium]
MLRIADTRNLNGVLKRFGNSLNHSRKDRICAIIIDYGILGLLIFTPLPAASVHEWSVLVIQLVVLVLMAAYILIQEKPQINEFISPACKWLKYLFFCFFVFVFIQFLPLPKLLVRFLSPSSYNYQKMYAVDFSNIKFLSLSVIPSYTFQRILELLAYFLLGFLVVKTVTKRYQIMRIYSVVIAMGIFQALYGMFELYNKSPNILFYKKIYNLESVTGTFVNRNHLSGYLEMVIPLAIGLVIARIDLFALKSLTWRERLLRLSEKGLSRNLLVSFGVVLMAIAIIFSQSRSGVFILIFTFILFFGLTAIYFEIYNFHIKWIKKFLSISFFVIIFISLYIGIDATLERFSLDRLLHEGRPTYWANTLRTFSNFPFFGTGLGTFGALYPPIDGGAGPMSVVHAHNDYLEYLAELGVIGFSLLLGGILFMIVRSFSVWRTRRHPEVKGLTLGGIISLICILIHSLTDFNLHIPANMVLFSVVLSLTMVLAYYRRGAAPEEKR